MHDKIKEWKNAILRSLIILVVLFFCLWPVRLQGISMSPTLNNGDLIFISRIFAQIGHYDTGDIVVFDVNYNGNIKKMIKRVVATEGDHIVLLETGEIQVNGKILKEKYSLGRTHGIVDMVVPEGYLFLLGDNRENSMDSRQIGAISKENIKGKAVVRWYPFNKIQLLL